MSGSSLRGRASRRLRYWLRRADRKRLLREEMAFHIESLTEQLVSRGMSPEKARQSALNKFGNITLQAEDADSTWISRWLRDLASDLRHATRIMRRELGVTAFVMLITGLGIGASATVFSVVNALLLRPLPFRDPAALVWISNDGENHEEWTTQVGYFVDLRRSATTLLDMAGWDNFYQVGDSELTGVGEPERLTSVPVTQNLFGLLGIEPALGRFFTPDEANGSAATPRAVILSHGFWVRRFAADPTMVGRTLTLNHRPVPVVGVLPASFDFASVFTPGTATDVFVPWPLTDQTNRQGNTMRILARLRPGATAAQAQAELKGLAPAIERRHPDRNWERPVVVPLATRVSGSIKPPLLVLAGAVGLVMLIVGANLSNLQLARLGARQKEMAVRAALGAGRLRLLRQLFSESLLLTGAGALVGLGLAIVGTRELAHLTALKLPLLNGVHLDFRAIAVALATAVVTGVLFSIVPAVHVWSWRGGVELNDGARGSTRGNRAWLRSALVVSEVALACPLLVGTALLTRSFLRLLDVNLGFQPAHVVALRADPSFKFTSWQQQNTFLDDLLTRSRALPGIQAAGMTDALPFATERSWGIRALGQTYEVETYIRVVTDGYFEATGIALREGRLLTPQDRATSQKVILVNETLAKSLWGSRSAVGQRLNLPDTPLVIGVVDNVRHHALEETGGAELYFPMRQMNDYGNMQLVVRTTVPEDALAGEIRAGLRPLDPNLPVQALQPLQDLVDRTVSPRRFVVVLLVGFAGFALLLASLGIYAVVGQSVNQRTQEIGIRMALGASAGKVARGLLFGTLGLVSLGLIVGLTLSRLFTTALASLLFGVRPSDPVTFIAMALTLAVVAAFAAYLPARRVSRIDPTVTLRAD